MKYFLNLNMSNTSRAVILTILVSYVSAEAEQANNIPAILMKVLQKYENFKKPNDNDFDETSNAKELRKSTRRSEIEDTIRAKVVELGPFLDDNKYNRRHGDDFVESSHKSINPAILRYKKMRKEIEKLLKIEPITYETKSVVIEALDQIENELNVNDCYWKKVDVVRRRNLRVSEPSIAIPKEMRRTEIIMKHIKDKWDKIVNQYSIPDDKNLNDSVRKIAFVFLTRLRQFVFDTHDDYTKLQDRYEMKCGFDDEVNKTGPQFPVFRPDDNETLIKIEKGDCDDIMICSEELLDFLTDFYDQLNKTYTEVFKNYIVMYIKEIDAEDEEKISFTEVLGNIQEQLYPKIKKMFKRELEKLNEVFSLASSRISALKHLIDRTVHNAKEEIYAALSVELKKFKPILRLTVKQDINIATGIELDNLHKEFKDKMCSTFRHCNSAIDLRRHKKQYSNVDPNSIKIRFKLGLGDDPMKLLRPYLSKIKGSKRFRSSKANKRNGPEIKELNELSARKINLPVNIKAFKGINVTRTTYAEYVEKGTTKIINGSLKNDTNVTIMESSISY